MTTSEHMHDSTVPFSEALRFWAKLGCISFGGPAGQIAIMHIELVERRKWITEKRFLRALNYCMLLPGPEAQQLATYAGWMLHGTKGAIAAGGLFVIPSVIILWTLSYLYVSYGQTGIFSAFLYGLNPAVIALIVAAGRKIGKKALRTPTHWIAACLALLATATRAIPYPMVLLAAGGLGALTRPRTPNSEQSRPGETHNSLSNSELTPSFLPSTTRNVFTLGAGLIVWWLPILFAAVLLGSEHVLTHEGIFFAKATLITFGGAYAILPYVAQTAVEQFHWLSDRQMLDGLGLAETTPGPLIMVLQFVGFLGGWNAPAPFSPLVTATLAALMTTWVTFIPSFLWILLGAPYVERLAGVQRLEGALSMITATVVGVITNLALYFGWQVFFPRGQLDPFALFISLAVFAALSWMRLGIVTIVLCSGAAGLLRYFAFQS